MFNLKLGGENVGQLRTHSVPPRSFTFSRVIKIGSRPHFSKENLRGIQLHGIRIFFKGVKCVLFFFDWDAVSVVPKSKFTCLDSYDYLLHRWTVRVFF